MASEWESTQIEEFRDYLRESAAKVVGITGSGHGYNHGLYFDFSVKGDNGEEFYILVERIEPDDFEEED